MPMVSQWKAIGLRVLLGYRLGDLKDLNIVADYGNSLSLSL
jgi:hypothetical protein